MQDIEFKNGLSVKELFRGDSDEDVKHKMDRRAKSLVNKHGGVVRVKRNKIGRNAPCPCGSGEKFKKCCLFSQTISDTNEEVMPSEHDKCRNTDSETI